MYGIIDLKKEAGVSSHKCVNDIRHILGIKRVGHSGTLDVEVSGVLNIYVGRNATKFIDIIKSDSKKYTAEFEFFKSSDTYDIWGDVVDAPIVGISKENLVDTINRFIGEIEQVPPMYSALKHKGKPLYKYARSGIDIERASRKIVIHDIRVIRFDGTKATIDIVCSKGTYVRSLIHDIGVQLKTDAVMTSLVRTENDYVNQQDTYKIDDIRAMAKKGDYRFIRSMDKYLTFESLDVNKEEYNKLLNGRMKYFANDYLGEKIMLKYNREFVGIAVWNDKKYMVKRII